MKSEFIYSLTNTFESHAQQTEEGIEFWLARDLQHLLGYSKWGNFLNVVTKAKIACETSDHLSASSFFRVLICLLHNAALESPTTIKDNEIFRSYCNMSAVT